MGRLFTFSAFAFIFLMLLSCRNRKEEGPSIVRVQVDSIASVNTTVNFWEAVPEAGLSGVVLHKAWPIGKDSVSVDGLIALMNGRYPQIRLSRMAVSGDTLFVRIDQEKHLTQELGSTGADAYMAEATYNLTSCPGIRVVHFRFKRGEHATPGSYTREEFRAVGFP
jgi:hypothetical protein